MKNKNIFMARKGRKGKRAKPGRDRAPKVDRPAFIWRRSLGLTIKGFNRYLQDLEA